MADKKNVLFSDCSIETIGNGKFLFYPLFFNITYGFLYSILIILSSISFNVLI